MTIRKIAAIGHPVLRAAAEPVPVDEIASPYVQGLIDDLIETMRDAQGAGLAANQVHDAVQICVMEVTRNARYPYKPPFPLRVLVNPELEFLDDEVFDVYEGCLSVPDLRGVVPRHMNVRVRALDRDGLPIDTVVRGITAGTYQHEVDHLRGTLIVDRVGDTRSLCTWNEFDRWHRDEFVRKAEAIVRRHGS